jgi:non-lysosomal glucosylceramidase
MAAAPTYRDQARRCVALPLGGIGTGHVSICGDGGLRQWQLGNTINHLGHVPESFFAVRASSTEPPLNVSRILQARLPQPPEEAAPNVSDHIVPLDRDPPDAHWDAIASTEFEAAYPFARIRYIDAALPVAVSLEAFTPLVPLDTEASSLPLASFSFTVTNRADCLVHGWLLATLQNTIGWDGVTPIEADRCSLFGGNVNRLSQAGELTALVMDNATVADDDPRAGELVLATTAPSVALPQFARSGDALSFVDGLKLLGPTIDDDWSDSAMRHACAEVGVRQLSPSGESPAGATWSGALAAAFAVAPGKSATVEFVISWRYPNRVTDFDQFALRDAPVVRVGNAYARRHPSALAAAQSFERERDRLHGQSRAWTDALLASELPEVAVEMLLAQPSLIRSPTTFRTEDGRFYGFEGCLGASTLNWSGSVGGSCPLNCNHVWNYEQGLSRLFPELERSMRETELEGTQAPEGYLPHRVLLPLTLHQMHGSIVGGPVKPALDGMLGAVLKSYREIRQGAGEQWLADLWPRLVRLMDYIDRTWNVNGDGVLVGEQPVTYDIALHGPNMFVGGLWLAALRAMEEMARIVAPEQATRYHELFERASARYDELLFDGEYYAQLPTESAHEFGEGCLSDQLLGQWWAHQLELGYVLPLEHVRSALEAVVRHNLRHGFRDFEHGYRVFADADDSGLLVCTWPKGGRPAVPVRYCDEVWTGVEYQVAAHCLMEGLDEQGMELLTAVRGRYDGTRRNPFNEVECGDHYARALAGFSVLEALTGFRYDAVSRRITTTARYGRYPFLAGSGWGEIEFLPGDAVRISCRGGSLDLAELVVDGDDARRVYAVTGTLEAGQTLTV